MQEYKCTNRTCGAFSTSPGFCNDCGSEVKAIGISKGINFGRLATFIVITAGLIGGATLVISIDPAPSLTPQEPTAGPVVDPFKGLIINFYGFNPCAPEVEVVNPDVIRDNPGYFDAFRLTVGNDVLAFNSPGQTFDFRKYDRPALSTLKIEVEIEGEWKEYPGKFDPQECPNKPLTASELADLRLKAEGKMKKYFQNWKNSSPADRRNAFEFFASAEKVTFPDGKEANGTNWQTYYQMRYPERTLTAVFDIDEYGIIKSIQFR